MIHYLVFAVDAFPGRGELDNLGLPKAATAKATCSRKPNGKRISLAKMQDDDGGFYFLVYPKERAYEDDVTAGSTAIRRWSGPKRRRSRPRALRPWPKPLRRRCSGGSSRRQPAAILEKARKGWAFLQNALRKYGRDGAYQKISHYGHEFLHDDELAWAAAEMFCLTGERPFQKELISRFDPTDRETKRWTWWRMFEGYGCAIRSYAFAAQTGTAQADQLDAAFLDKCRNRDPGRRTRSAAV